MRLGVIHEAHALEVHVAGALGDLEALAEVAVRPVVLPEVGVRDAEIHVSGGRAVLVVGGTIGFDRPLVVADRFDELAADVREDPQVHLDPGTDLARFAAPLERLQEIGAGLIDRAGPQRQTAHRVQRLGGEKVVAQRTRDLEAAIAEVPRPRRFVAVMQHDGEAPQRLGQHGPLVATLGRGNRAFIQPHRFGYARGALFGARLVQEIRCGTHFEEWASRSTAPSRSARLGPLLKMGVTHHATT